MFKYIKRIIGELTLPKDTYKCRTGRFWVAGNYDDALYPYQYQQIKQGLWGNWKLKTFWVSVNDEFDKV